MSFYISEISFKINDRHVSHIITTMSPNKSTGKSRRQWLCSSPVFICLDKDDSVRKFKVSVCRSYFSFLSVGILLLANNPQKQHCTCANMLLTGTAACCHSLNGEDQERGVSWIPAFLFIDLVFVFLKQKNTKGV